MNTNGMRRKSIFQYTMLTLFVMCMGLALFASLDYVTRATEREYLRQGVWLLGCAFAAVVLFALMRAEGRFSRRVHGWSKTSAEVLVVGFALAWGFMLRYAVIQKIPLEPASDFDTYYKIAEHLVNNTLLAREAEGFQRYIAMFPHAAGFPMLVLFPVFRVFGVSVQNALMANLAYNMGSILLAYGIARRFAGRFGGMICALVLALWPSHILYSTMVASEPSFTFYILLGTYTALAAMGRDERSLYAQAPGLAVPLLILSGVFLGIAAAIRPMAVILVAVLCIVMLGTNRAAKSHCDRALHQLLNRGWLCALITLICYMATSAVISQHVSELIGEKPASGITASGYNLMVGVNVQANGLWNQEDADFFSDAYDKTGSADEAHALCMQVALERIQAQPEDVLNLFIYKFQDLWRTDDFGIDWNLLYAGQQNILTDAMSERLEGLRPIGRGLYMGVLLLAFLGGLQLLRSNLQTPALPLTCVLFFLGTALLHMLLETQVRYHYNMIPYLILMDVSTLAAWRKRIHEAPPERIVLRMIPPEHLEAGDDHTRFDIGEAIREGHILVSATEAYEKETRSDDSARNEPEPGQVEPMPEETKNERRLAS